MIFLRIKLWWWWWKLNKKTLILAAKLKANKAPFEKILISINFFIFSLFLYVYCFSSSYLYLNKLWPFIEHTSLFLWYILENELASCNLELDTLYPIDSLLILIWNGHFEWRGGYSKIQISLPFLSEKKKKPNETYNHKKIVEKENNIITYRFFIWIKQHIII